MLNLDGLAGVHLDDHHCEELVLDVNRADAMYLTDS
jgi:hypothetical protein